MKAGTINDASWRMFRNQLYRFVLKRVHNEADAEDLVHDVFVKAYTHQNTLADGSKLRPWLYQIARNTIADYYRHGSHVALPSENIGDLLANVPDDEHATSDQASDDLGLNGDNLRREVARCLPPLLELLPDGYRRALALVDRDGLTQKEAASHLGLSLSGAKSRVQRGRTMLRNALCDCCHIEFDRRGGIVDFVARPGHDLC